MTFSREWPGWVVLFCVGMEPVLHAAAFDAEAPKDQEDPPRPAPTVPKAEPARPQPAAGKRALIQALSDALQGGADRNAPKREELRVENRRALIAVPQDANEANLRTLESQCRPQLQLLLCVELAFLRRICRVDPEPFAEIAKAAKPGLRAVVHEYAAAQNAAMRGRVRIAGKAEEPPEAIDPRSQVQRLLVPLVESKLGREQAQRYRQECDKRTECRRRAVVLNLIAAIDERLALTAQQRDKLVQSLSSNYENHWDQYVQVFAYQAQYLPTIRHESIVPLLNERQKSHWQQAPTQGVRFFGGIGFARSGIAAQDPEVQEIARIVEEAKDER